MAYDLDLFRVCAALPRIEYARLTVGLHRAIAQARSMAVGRDRRDSPRRAKLRRIIARIDRVMPGGPNCVRRGLLEIALDGGAAREKFYAGFVRGGAVASGHAWLESHGCDRPFDAVLTI